MSAEAFFRDFNSDRLAAYEKYQDKDILLTGKAALDTTEDSGGKVILTLEGGAGTLDMIFCANEGAPPQIKDALLKVKQGERVEVKGQLSVPISQPMIWLEKCQLHP
jgi:DNA/RNA endonuclease YhcR with UshA esterase domain